MLTADDRRLDERRDEERGIITVFEDSYRRLARGTDPADVLLPVQSQVRVSVQR